MESNQHEKVNVANAKEAQKRLAKEALSIFKEPLQGIVGKEANLAVNYLNSNFHCAQIFY
jgi:hypothetical protein